MFCDMAEATWCSEGQWAGNALGKSQICTAVLKCKLQRLKSQVTHAQGFGEFRESLAQRSFSNSSPNALTAQVLSNHGPVWGVGGKVRLREASGTRSRHTVNSEWLPALSPKPAAPLHIPETVSQGQPRLRGKKQIQRQGRLGGSDFCGCPTALCTKRPTATDAAAQKKATPQALSRRPWQHPHAPQHPWP